MNTLLAFAAASIALIVIPGPNGIYIMTRSAAQGYRAGLVSALGVETGTLVHIAFAVLGVSTLVATSPVAFNVLKFAGAGYLLYLAVRTLRRPSELDFGGGAKALPLRRVFRDGVVVNVLNPKVALFFLAFLPQFVDVSRGHVAMQITILGLMLATLGVCTDSAFALLAGTVGEWLKRSRGYVKFERYGSGVLFVGLGVTAALSGTKK